MFYEGAVQDLIDELGRLPGIGPKSAQRVAFHLLQVEDATARRLAEVIVRVRDTIRFCDRCHNIAEGELCRICADPKRIDEVLCVVEEPRDVIAIERTREFVAGEDIIGTVNHRPESHAPERLWSVVCQGPCLDAVFSHENKSPE